MKIASFWTLNLILSLSALTTYLWGDAQTSRIASLETKMAAIKNDTVKKTTGIKLTSASPQIDGYGFFATADLLYWKLQEEGSDYSLSLKSPTLLTTGKAAHANFDWNFGFRTGVGYHMEHDAWDWYLNFTWFQSRANNTAHKGDNAGLAPQKGFGLLQLANKIQSHWNVHYYVIDLELGRSFFVSKFLSFRPQFGIESAWISQRRRYHIETNLDPGTGIFGENIYGKNNFFGIGPRTGIQGTWRFCPHFNLMGTVAGSLQWGSFDNTLSETALTRLGKVKRVDVDGDLHQLVPNVQMALMLGWDTNIMQDRFHLGIYLGYEFQYWWRQNQFLNQQQFTGTNFEHESRDLSLNGATLDIRFDF